MKRRSRVVGLIFLIFLGFVGNYFSLPLFFGVDFIFGSIATILAIHYLGTVLGLFTAFSISLYTYFLWNHPYAIIIFICEAFVIGWLYNRKKGEIVLSAIIYWCFIGIPLVWLFYGLVLQMNNTASLLIMLKQSINGILNTVIASFIINHVPFNRKLKAINLRSLIFNLFAVLVLIPTLIVVRIETVKTLDNIEANVRGDIIDQYSKISHMISLWHESNMIPLQELSNKIEMHYTMDSIDKIQMELEVIQRSFPYFHNVYVANENAITVAFSPLFNNKGETNIGIDFSDRKYYSDLKTTLNPVVSEIFMGRGGVFDPIVTLSVPITYDNEFQGFVLGAVNLNSLNNLIASTINNDYIELTILDENNQIITSTDPNYTYLGKYNKFNDGEKYFNDGIYFWQPHNKNLPIMTRWSQSYYYFEKPIEVLSSWTLIVSSSLAQFQTPLYNSYITILLISLVFIIFSLLLSYCLSYLILKPVNNLIKLTEDLPYKILNKQKVNWSISWIDEIQALMCNFKNMAERLNKTFVELNEHRDELYYLVRHDNLTGLPNMVSFREELEIELNKAKKNGEVFAVLFLDLDRFKLINDTLGHRVGDIFLIKLSERLKQVMKEDIAIYRQGGDEFLILLRNTMNLDLVTDFAKIILNETSKPIKIEGHELISTTSIGISIYPNDGEDIETLVKNADIAMYKVKQNGKNNYAYFSTEMKNSIIRARVIESELRQAIENEEFIVLFQPIIDASTGNLRGAEALIRWQHPVLGTVSPLEFISVAEETGLIKPIGEWVIRTACNQVYQWQRKFGIPLSISVNLSMVQLSQEKIVGIINRILEESQLEPQFLILEITESYLAENIQETIIKFQELKRLGIKIALDDFGTGYSSLNYLKRLPIDIIKIDKSFVDGMINNDYDNWIVEVITIIAHTLNLKVIGEGVETREQFDFLKSKECDSIQGYFINPPVHPDEFERFLISKTTNI